MLTELMLADKATLEEGLEMFTKDADKQCDIPFWVWLLENPQSPFALPGKIDLFNHDCLHVILGLGKSPEDEAIVLGITFGSHPQFNRFHLLIIKFFSRFIYPEVFKFKTIHLKMLEKAYLYARSQQLVNLSNIDFSQESYQNTSLGTLRQLWKIKLQDIKNLKFIDTNQLIFWDSPMYDS